MESKLELYETASGFKYHLFPNDFISNSVKETGFFAKHLLDLSSQILFSSKSNPGLVLDIGANLGTFSIPLASWFSEFYFCAFEPLKFVHQNLQSNVDANGLTNIKCYNLALSNTTKTEVCKRLPYGTIHPIDQCSNVGGTSLKEEMFNFAARVFDLKSPPVPELIEFRDLDSFNLENVSLIKLDVETMELEVLEGAKQTIRNNNLPPILYESLIDDMFMENNKKVFHYLQFLGYECFLELPDANILAVRDFKSIKKFGLTLKYLSSKDVKF